MKIKKSNDNTQIEYKDIPIGLGMAFAQNTEAMSVFTSMTKEKQLEIIDKARHAGSKNEMQNIVSSLVSKNMIM